MVSAQDDYNTICYPTMTQVYMSRMRWKKPGYLRRGAYVVAIVGLAQTDGEGHRAVVLGALRVRVLSRERNTTNAVITSNVLPGLNQRVIHEAVMCKKGANSRRLVSVGNLASAVCQVGH
jgi:hypothetical protein